MWQDPIISELRKYREAHAAKYNYDLELIYKALKEDEKKSDNIKVSFPAKKISVEQIKKV